MSDFVETHATNLTGVPSCSANHSTTPLSPNQQFTGPCGNIDISNASCDREQLALVAPSSPVIRSSGRSAKRFKIKTQTIKRHMCPTEVPDTFETDCPDEKLCKECGKMLNVETGYVNHASARTGKKYLNSACRPCHNHRTAVVAKLKLKHEHPAAGTPCECCGRISKLFLDHTHSDDTFRGWICRECNSGIGLLGDSVESLKKALVYLEASK